MKIVVVIVTYNPRKWLEKCLNSIMQSTIFLETIIIDNKSTDGSPVIIKNKFPEVTLVESYENLGFGRANNIGIKKALENEADYVFLLNQDAWVEKDTIEKLVSAQLKEPEYGIISPIHLNGLGNALDYNFSNYIIPSKCQSLYSDLFLNTIRDSVYKVSFVNAAAWLLTRKCLERIGGFNPSFFHYGEDDNYIQRVHYHGFKVGILPTTVLYHDRNQRKSNYYFESAKAIYQREIILKISNPYHDFSFYSEYKKRIKNLVKAICRLHFKSIIQISGQIKVLNNLDRKAIVDAKNESKLVKQSFLDK